MKRLLVLVLVVLFSMSSFVWADGFENQPIIKNVWTQTGNTLHKGEFSIGLSSYIGFGVTDNTQVGMNILKYLFQVYNADVKVNLQNTPNFAVAAGLEFDRFDADIFVDEDAEDDVAFTSFSPYLAISNRLSDNTWLHLSARHSFFDGEGDIDDVEVEETFSGSSISSGFHWGSR